MINQISRSHSRKTSGVGPRPSRHDLRHQAAAAGVPSTPVHTRQQMMTGGGMAPPSPIQGYYYQQPPPPPLHYPRVNNVYQQSPEPQLQPQIHYRQMSGSRPGNHFSRRQYSHNNPYAMMMPSVGSPSPEMFGAGDMMMMTSGGDPISSGMTPYGGGYSQQQQQHQQMYQPATPQYLAAATTSIQRPTFTIYPPHGDFFLRDTGAIELMISLLGGQYQRMKFYLGDERIGGVLRTMLGGGLYSERLAVVSDGALLCEFSSAARCIARKFGCYGQNGQADYTADVCLVRLESWRRDQDLALNLATRWLLEKSGRGGVVGGVSTGGVSTGGGGGPPSEIQEYLKSRHFYYEIFASLLRCWKDLYRDHTTNTSWIDPLIYARIIDDQLLDEHMKNNSNFSFDDVEKLTRGGGVSGGEIINQFFNSMKEGHYNTFQPIIDGPYKLAFSHKVGGQVAAASGSSGGGGVRTLTSAAAGSTNDGYDQQGGTTTASSFPLIEKDAPKTPLTNQQLTTPYRQRDENGAAY